MDATTQTDRDPWHLFVIEVSDDKAVHAFVVSAQSGSSEKGQELAEAAALDSEHVGDEPMVVSARLLGETDLDVFEYIGRLAE